MSAGELLEKIRSKGRERIAEIERERDAQLAKIREDQSQEIERLEEDFRARTERETRLTLEKARSRARLEQCKVLLAAKWEVVEHVLELAGRKVLEDDSYLELVKTIVKRFGTSDAKVRLSKKDTEKLGKGLTLGPPAEISGGVIIEKDRQLLDFSLDESLAAIREELVPELARVLFPSRESDQGSTPREAEGR